MTGTTVDMPPGWRLLAHRASVDSTQDEVRAVLARLSAGAPSDPWPEGAALVLRADEQTGGRGRHGRVWDSPPGNLYLTIALPCPDGPRAGIAAGFIGGVALAEALGDLGFGGDPTRPTARLKWPNDVLVDGAKVAGLLPEMVEDGAGRPWVLLGMGINIASAPTAATMLYPVAALSAWPGAPPVDPDAMLAALLPRLAAWVTRWRAEGFAPLRAAWLTHGHGLGAPVRVRLGERTLSGLFEGLTPEGGLKLREPSGELRTVLAGDVLFPAAPEEGGRDAAGD
jgi:BirA family biotin operon repressor/biotin-[acetyl-CoA-carboxylase] ligase